MKKTTEQIRAQCRSDFLTFYCSEVKGLDGEDRNVCVANAQEVLEFFEAYEDAIIRNEAKKTE